MNGCVPRVVRLALHGRLAFCHGRLAFALNVVCRLREEEEEEEFICHNK